MNMLRPISRTYDRAEHAYPHELDLLAAMIDGLSDSGAARARARPASAASDGPTQADAEDGADDRARNGTNLASVLGISEMCWGDVGLLLSLPRQGLGNSAIASVGDSEQQERFGRLWASMAITEPDTGSDSANIRTTAVLDGDEYVLNGEKIFVTSGERSDAVVVWATLDKDLGRAAIKSFVVPKGTPGHDRRAARAQAGHPGLRHRDDPVRPLPGAGREPARLARDRHQPGLRRRDGDLRQHPATRRGDGRRLRQGVARPHPRPARRGGRRGRLRPAGRGPVRRGGDVPRGWRPTGRPRGC